MADASITEPLYVALIGLGVASLSTLAPLITILLTSRTRSREKQEDWRRQDVVAEQAAKAAKLLLDAQAQTSLQNIATQGQLRVIHTLVNSNLTKEMQDRFAALNAQIFLTKEVMRLNHLNNLEPDSASLAALHKLEEVAATLSTTLTERLTATDVANKGGVIK